MAKYEGVFSFDVSVLGADRGREGAGMDSENLWLETSEGKSGWGTRSGEGAGRGTRSEKGAGKGQDGSAHSVMCDDRGRARKNRCKNRGRPPRTLRLQAPTPIRNT